MSMDIRTSWHHGIRYERLPGSYLLKRGEAIYLIPFLCLDVMGYG